MFYDDKDRPNRYLLAKEQISRPDAGELEVSGRQISMIGSLEENKPKSYDQCTENSPAHSIFRFLTFLSPRKFSDTVATFWHHGKRVFKEITNLKTERGSKSFKYGGKIRLLMAF